MYEATTRPGAGQCAVWLWEHHLLKARPSIAGGWLRRARRRWRAITDGRVRQPAAAGGRGRPRFGRPRLGGHTGPRRARPGTTASSTDLEAEALQTIGRVLIDPGDVADGLGHLDEAMLSAVEGRLSPYSTGKVYCSLISACEQLGDLRRAAEWTDATMRWSENHPLAMWPGICRVHHAALLQLRGEWARPSARRGRPAPSSTASTWPTPPPATSRSARSAAGSATSTAPRRRSRGPRSCPAGRAPAGARAARPAPHRRRHCDHHEHAGRPDLEPARARQVAARPRPDRRGRGGPRRRGEAADELEQIAGTTRAP